MRDLRPDSLSDDGRSLLLSGADGDASGAAERYRVAVDERFRSVLRGRPASTSETRVESALPPKEIQARLRAGATAEEVAKAAGIPVARVQRYEVPIAAERARVVSEARVATVPPADRTHPGHPLGALVDAGLAREGQTPEDVAWEARRQGDGSWIVRVPVADRGAADFSWEATARRIRPIDALARELIAPAPLADPIEAVAEAAGVTTSVLDQDVPLAVGAEGRRPGGRSSSRPSNGLVVLAGSRQDAPSPASTPARVGTTDATGDAGVPGAVWTPPQRPAPSSPSTTDLDASRTVPGGGSAAGRSTATAEPAVTVPSEEPAATGPDRLFESAVPAAGPAKAPRARGGARRGAVPAWDDIVFGAKRT